MNETILERIEQYLDGSMPDEQVTEFENEMAEDPALRSLVDEIREIFLGLEAISDNKLREKVTKLVEGYHATQETTTNRQEAKYITMKTENRTSSAKWWLIAVSAVMIIGLLFFLLRDDTRITHNDMFTSVYKPDSDGATSFLDRIKSSMPDEADKARRDSLILAVVSYREFEYRKAIDLLHAYKNHYPNDEYAQYFLGLSHLALGNYKLSVEYLQPLLEAKDHDIQDNARYYLALSYSRFENNEANTKRLLEDILEDPYSDWKEEARDMIEFLE